MNEKRDLVIIGGGVAGLTASIYACRKGIDNVVLEAELPIGSTGIAPLIENYPGFPEGISGIELMQKIEKQAKKFGADIRTFEPVKELKIEGHKKIVLTNKGDYEAKAIIIAVGAKPVKIPEELGIQEDRFIGRGLSYCATCDGPLFKGKRVVVIGNENEAFNEALYLSELCSEVTLVAPKQINADKVLIERFKERGKIVQGEIKGIVGEEVVEGVIIKTGDEEKTLPVQGVFVALGRKAPAIEVFQKAGIDIKNRFIEVDRNMETNIKGIFAAGDVTGQPFQIAKAVGEACVAAISAYKYIKTLHQ